LDELFDPGVVRYNSLVTKTVCLGFPERPPAARHRILRMPPRVCEENEIGAVCVGPVSRSGYVCRRCPCNVVNAFCLRHGAEPPPVTEVWSEALEYWDTFIKARPWLYSDLYPLEFETWLRKWPKHKQDMIMRSIDEDKVLLGELQAMIKREAGWNPPTKARLVQFDKNPATLAAVGPDITCLQKTLFEWANGFTYKGIRVTFASGLDGGGLAQWMEDVLHRFPHPYFYERDGKNWDSCMVELHHSLRMRIYTAYSPELARHVDACFNCVATVMFPEGKFKYRICGTNKSGHADTTLFNCIVNASITIEALARLGRKAEVIIVGDDLLVASDEDLSGMVEIERGFGIVPVARQFRDPLEVSFISGCWLPSSTGWMFLPKLGRLFAKLWWTCSPPAPKKLRSYRYSVVTGLRAVVGDVPLYADFLHAAVAPLMPLGRDFELRAANYGGAKADGVTLDALCRKYHMSPSDIIELAGFLRSLPDEPCTMKHPLIDQVMEVDLVDPLDRPLLSG